MAGWEDLVPQYGEYGGLGHSGNAPTRPDPKRSFRSYPQAGPFRATSAAVSNTCGIRFFLIP